MNIKVTMEYDLYVGEEAFMSVEELAQYDSSAHVKVYHNIILEEARLISGRKENILGEILRIKNYKYCLDEDKLISIAEATTGVEDRAKDIIKNLISNGLIIKVRENCFRSFHMDFLIRLSDVRLHPKASRMVLSSRFGVATIPIFPKALRTILPKKEKDCKLCEELYYTMLKFLDSREDLINIIYESLKEYFTRKGSKGFDPYQAFAIMEALRSDKKGYVIIAPTGSGKTEIFMTIGVLYLLREYIRGSKEKKIILTYPRKMLEIDQAGRIIEFLRILNEKLRAYFGENIFKIFLRDGDTNTLTDEVKKTIKDNKAGFANIDFRGISCGRQGKLLINVSADGKTKVICNEAGDEYDFIIPVKSPEAKDANIIITTWNTLMYRIVSSTKEDDITVNDLLKTIILVLDEVHEYNSMQVAVISYIIAILRNLITKYENSELRCIVSTATLPDPLSYAQSVLDLNNKNEMTDLSFKSIMDKLNKHLDLGKLDKRLVVSLIVQMLPRSSWMTYLSEALAVQMLLFKMYRHSKKKFLPQAIAFINNIREVNRIRAVLENQISSGSPLDNLCIRRFKCEEMNPQDFRNIVSHYLNIDESLKNEILKLIEKEGSNATLYALLAGLYEVVYSGVNLKKRSEIYEKMLKQEIATILATSSLELGMDYSTVSLIFNIGFDKPESLIQRFGRGGRSSKSMFTTLAIQVLRNNPLDYRFFNRKDLKNVIIHSIRDQKIEIPRKLSAIRLRMALNLLLILRALWEPRSSATRRITKESDLIRFLEELLEMAKKKDFREIAISTGIFTSEREYLDFVKLLSELKCFYENKKYVRILNVLEAVPEKFIIEDTSSAIIRVLSNALEKVDDIYKDYRDVLQQYLNNIPDSLPDLGNLHEKSKEMRNVLYEIQGMYLKLYESLEYAVDRLHEVHVDKEFASELHELMQDIMEKARRLRTELYRFNSLCSRIRDAIGKLQEACYYCAMSIDDEKLREELKDKYNMLKEILGSIENYIDRLKESCRVLIDLVITDLTTLMKEEGEIR